MEKKNQNGQLKEQPPVAPPLFFSARLSYFIMSSFAMFTVMFQRFNMNFALVCMVKSTVPNHTLLITNEGNQSEEMDEDECIPVSHDANATTPFDGEFEWSKAVQANILGSFFYGFIATQILGGWLSDKFGGKQLYIGSILILSVLTLVNPIAAIQGPEYLFTVRLIQGLSHGALLPLLNVIGLRWAGQAERSFLISIAYFGFSLAAFATYPICAVICKQLGWTFIFYITGGSGVVWCFFAQIFIYNWPEDHPRISAQELEYLKTTAAAQKDGAHANKRLIVPWRRIIFSLPVNVVHVTHFCAVWSITTIGISLPQFLKEVLRMDISKNGFYSALPFLGMLIFHMGIGALFDFVRLKHIFTVTTLRKMFNTVGFFLPGISLCMMTFLTCTDNIPGIVGISIGLAFCQFALMGGYFLSVFELAPRYSGILTGITNTIGIIPGFLCPIVVNYITRNKTREEWLTVFYVCAGVNFLGGAIYLLFGSSQLQSWAAPKSRPPKEMKPLQDKLLIEKENDVLLTEKQSDI